MAHTYYSVLWCICSRGIKVEEEWTPTLPQTNANIVHIVICHGWTEGRLHFGLRLSYKGIAKYILY